MTKLKDDKTCHCHDRAGPDQEPLDRKPCRFGLCTVFFCPSCGLQAGIEWGPVLCPHKKNENGTLRWLKYPDMDRKKPVPRGKLPRRNRKARVPRVDQEEEGYYRPDRAFLDRLRPPKPGPVPGLPGGETVQLHDRLPQL